MGAGEMQIPVIQKSHELGIFSVVADYDAGAPGFIYADEKLLISSIDCMPCWIILKENVSTEF